MLLRNDNIEDVLDLTSMQHGLLYNYISNIAGSLYQEQISITLKGIIDTELIKASWNKVVENNEMLRTIFKWGKINKPVQIVLKKYDIPFEIIDLSKKLDIDNEFDIVFNLKLKENINIQNESIKIIICKIDENTANIIIKNHHILYDGWSTGIILKEFMEYYNAYLGGEKPLNKVKNKFKNYIKYNNIQNDDEAEKFWKDYLKHNEYILESIDENESKDFKKYTYKFSKEIEVLLELYGKTENVSKATILYTIWGILQGKYTGQNDIVFGTPVSGRGEKVHGINDMVGLFINTIPLRVKFSDNQEFRQLIKEVDEGLKQRLTYENTSLIDIKKYSDISNQDMLFDNIVVVENYPLDKSIYEDNLAKIVNYRIHEHTNFNLTIELLSFSNLEMDIVYNSNVYNNKYIENMAKHYEILIKQCLKETNIMVGDLELINDKERNKIVIDFNETYVEFPKNKTIHELFEEQVEKTPNNIALIYKDKKNTYKELNEESNQLARFLSKEYGVKKGDVVSIHLDRSIDMVVAIIAVLKINAVCLPIGAKYPNSRVVEMLIDSDAKVVLNNDENIVYSGYIGESVKYDRDKYTKYSKDNLINDIDSEQLGYLIYTSGSTGKPKAVMISHKGIINHAYAKIKEINMTSIDRCCHNLSFNFVASIWQVFSPMFLGASVYLYEENIISDGYKLFKSIEEDRISIVEVVPSLLNTFIELEEEKRNEITLKKVKKLLLTGERVPVELVNKFYNKYKVELINAYGQSEFSDDTIHYHIPYDTNTKRMLIGKPTNNTRIYILDKSNKLVPLGVSGEICISGDGISKGYLNNEKLTEEKFIDNPYEPENKMYKTGDLAKWNSDGNIEFLGRADHQVKIRGFRIELAEIQYNLSKIDGIKECLVIDKGKDSNKYLSAYYVAEEEIDSSSIKEKLNKSLPYYMIPSYFVRVEKMPLTANGKIDRKKLKSINDDINFITVYETPKNKVEETLMKIWSEVLEIKKIGINDNFFDLRGHSLKATILMSKIHKELNREVPLKELLNRPTIKELSKYIIDAEEKFYLKIEKVEEQEYYEVSSAQKRMYMIQQFDKDSTAYNIPVVFEVEGKVNKDKIEETFRKLIKRHEALRTYFEIFDSKIIQKLKNDYMFHLIYRNESRNIEDIIKSFVRAFDLEKTPLFRVELVENKEKTYLLIDMHHIISDGVSMSILMKEFTEIYNGKTLEPLKLQYKDFASWQNNFLKSEDMKKQEEYWINVFNDEIPVLNIPTDYKRPPMQSFDGDCVNLKVNKDITHQLKNLTRQTETTMHMVLFSAFNILLSKYSGQEDIIIGTPIAGRPHADLHSIMGMFVNTLALRNKPEGYKRYLNFLYEVKDNLLKAYSNQSYQLETLIEKLDIVRDTSRNPLFDVMFNMVDTLPDMNMKLNDMSLLPYDSNNNIAKFDLTLNAMEQNDEINISIGYCSKLFSKNSIERLAKHYLGILESITTNCEIELREIEILSYKEKNFLLNEFNDTKAGYPREKTIQELFEEQVEITPDNIAVVFENKKLTYRELNEKSNSLARMLRDKGVKSEIVVGIMIERSLEMIIGIMGILKSGGAYLPIDPKLPKDRIKYMIEDSGLNILVSVQELINELSFEGVILDLKDEKNFNMKVENLELINKCNNLAYVIYTSGTTGNPKGVMVEHNNVVRLMFNENMPFNFNDTDVWTMFHSYCFDFSVWEMYGALLYGGKLVIVPSHITKDFEKYLYLLKQEKVTILNQTPSAFYNLMNIELSKEDKELKLRYIIFGGEALNPKVLYEWKQKYNKTNLINMYGITETTIHVTYKEIDITDINKGISNIGKPIPTLTTYVMNDSLKLQPIGVPGELCIGGDGVSRGYLNRKELTEQKFVVNPYNSNEIIYRSGDLVKVLENGELEYIGRKDNQVKIRGFRIELAEIENTLLKHESVKELTVLVKESKENEKYICAYVVSDKNLQELDLKGYLKETLPEYMVPAYFVKLEKMPLTTNGKLDRRMLPEPNLVIDLKEYDAPRNKIEESLCRIWSDVLGIQKIGITDNFFELGGHSLKATMLISKIHRELNKELPLKELFRSPTIKELSKIVESEKDYIYTNIEKVEEKEYYEVSSAQKRMYLLQQFDLQSVSYNMPGVMLVEGKLDVKRIEKSFTKIIERHESLRTSFENIKGKIVQKISENVYFEMKYTEKYNENIQELINNAIQAFDLSKAPLLKVCVFKLEDEKYIVMLDMHHIISDGFSMSILIDEFIKLYDGNKLQEVNIQYKDYANWQNELFKSNRIKSQEEYWINRLSDEVSLLNMPTDYARPAIKSFKGDNISFTLDNELTKGLNKLAKETDTTMYMVLLSAINILLSKYSGQEDIIIGSPIAGRQHVDLEKVIGVFVNILVMRNNPKEKMSYIEFLSEVKENSLMAYENQDYQFEELVDKLNLTRDISRNPLFDVMFIMQNIKQTNIEINDLVFKTFSQENKISKFDITFIVSEIKEGLELNIEYCTDLFKKETIEGLINHLLNILKVIVNDINIKLSEIDMLSVDERYKLVHEFNNNYTDYPKTKTIHELFEEQVEKTPNNIAIQLDDKKLTYHELNERTNNLAYILRKNGVNQDSIVGILTERSLNMIVGMMAILKAGGAYLPIDVNYPKQRIAYMLEDSKTNLLLTQSKFVESISFTGEIINLDEIVYGNSEGNVKNINTSKDLAYVIYTSGSTGNPKGVLIEHASVNNFIKGVTDVIRFSCDKTILALTSISFDIFLLETLLPMIKGMKVIIASEEQLKDPEAIKELIISNKINMLQCTPSRMQMLLKGDGESIFLSILDTIMIGGEAFPQGLLSELHKLYYGKLYNMYGPTETTVWSSIKDLSNSEKINIGMPIVNTQMYIINKNYNLQPIGIAGELCIAGDGLARGYLNNEVLTTDKFIFNKFVNNKRMYKTGDLARWCLDGTIEFLGRIDYQVKIRGYRVELEEVEKILNNYSTKLKAVVVDEDDEDGNKYLSAYIVSDDVVNLDNIRKYLLKYLPTYMIPSYMYKIEELPLTQSGKVDKIKLKSTNKITKLCDAYISYENEIEKRIANIWKDTLFLNQQINRNDNFFELGGHSLNALSLISKIHEELNVKMTLVELFKNPTIKELAQYIENSDKYMYSTIKVSEPKEFYPLSSHQKRMYILNYINEDTRYNMTSILLLDGKLNKEKFEYCMQQIVDRHQSLRTEFKFIGTEPVQKICDKIEIKVNYLTVNFNELNKTLESLKCPFNLNCAPLFRIFVISLSVDKYVVMFDMHHIISDGISLEIIKDEFSKLYNGEQLPELKIQYKDFSVWQNERKGTTDLINQEMYWLNEFKDNIPILNMPSKYQRNLVLSFNGAEVSFKFDINKLNKLKDIAIKNKTTLSNILFSVYNILIYKYSLQNDIVVGLTLAGREHVDLQYLIGMFVNTVPIRTYLENNKQYSEFLGQVTNKVLYAIENQNYQFDDLVAKLGLQGNVGRNPLFDVAFVFQKVDMKSMEIKDIKISEYNIENKTAQFDLLLIVTEKDDEVNIVLQYSTDLFSEITGEGLIKNYEYILNQIIDNPNIELKNVRILDKYEKEDLYENKEYLDFEF